MAILVGYGRERTMQDTQRKETRVMTTHKTGTRAEWLTARLELLEAEKELTRRSDELARRRTMWTGPAAVRDRLPRGFDAGNQRVLEEHERGGKRRAR
jgi:hypothetical protein